MTVKKYNASIDIFKYLCSIMVVDCHMRLINIDKSFLYEFFRITIFFLFCSFGYYFMKGLKKGTPNIALKNIKRIAPPCIFWAIIYTLINLYNDVLSGRTDIKSFLVLQLKSMFVNGVGFHMWFIWILLIYVVIGEFIYKKRLLKATYFVCIPLYLLGLLGSYYYCLGNSLPLIRDVINLNCFPHICRLLLHGFPMFILGLYISENEEKCLKISDMKTLICLFLSITLTCLEIIFVLKYLEFKTNICSIFLLPFTYFLFVYMLKHPLEKYSKYAKAMKYMSSFMYYSHPLFRTIIASMSVRLFNIEISGFFMTMIISLVSSLTGYILYRINNQKLNKILS